MTTKQRYMCGWCFLGWFVTVTGRVGSSTSFVLSWLAGRACFVAFAYFSRGNRDRLRSHSEEPDRPRGMCLAGLLTASLLTFEDLIYTLTGHGVCELHLEHGGVLTDEQSTPICDQTVIVHAKIGSDVADGAM